MDIIYTCPLGSECEEAKDGKIYRCRWFVKLQGVDPQNGSPIDEFRCSHEWSIIMSVENTQQQRQTGSAVESFRNEMVKSNNTLISKIEATKDSHDNSAPHQSFLPK